MQETSQSDTEAVEKLSSSESMLRLVDALKGLDRDSLSRVVSAYLLLRSRGRENEFASFLVSREMGSVLSIAWKLMPAFGAGVIEDGEFRSALLGLVTSGIRSATGSRRRT